MKLYLSKEVAIDLPKLIETRLLIQANSGGGKSWSIRRNIEQAFGKVQIIVIDPEGEFTNLREKFDFVYAGKGGDAPADPRAAALLARRLLELKASAIVDLYELPPHDRKRFVRLFFEAMLNAPKELWNDVLVILDEAHVFAPEKDQAESLGAVIDMASRGRKRGFCLIPATQRPAKLHKDVAAECNNKLIGRASLDIDRKRAAEELGFTTREQVLSLRDLEPGEFYAFGPAISRDIVRVRIGDVSIKPQTRGRAYLPPPPTAKVKKILAQLVDLPKEAEEELRTMDGLRARIRTLEAEKRAENPVVVKQNPVRIERIEVPAIGKRSLERIEKAVKEVRTYAKKAADANAAAQHAATTTITAVDYLVEEIRKKVAPPAIGTAVNPTTVQLHTVTPRPAQVPRHRPEPQPPSEGISNSEQRVLDAIAWMGSIGIDKPEKTIVAFLSGYAHLNSKGFTNPCGSLRSKGLIDYPSPGLITLTDAGIPLANAPTAVATTEELHRIVLDRLDGPKRKVLQPLLACYPEPLTGEVLATAAGYAHQNSKGYTNPRGALKSFGLIEYPTPGSVRASSVLFL